MSPSRSAVRPGVELDSNAAEQIIDLGYVVAATDRAEPDVPNLVSEQRMSRDFVLISRTGDTNGASDRTR